jgi:hypothetical protein
MSRTPAEFADDLKSAAISKAMLRSLNASAFRMEARAKLNATTYPRVRTGRLRGSIKGRAVQTAQTISIRLWAGGEGIKYAIYQEKGTIHLAPRRYLERARNAEGARARESLSKAVATALREGAHG